MRLLLPTKFSDCQFCMCTTLLFYTLIVDENLFVLMMQFFIQFSNLAHSISIAFTPGVHLIDKALIVLLASSLLVIKQAVGFEKLIMPAVVLRFVHKIVVRNH